MTHQDDLEAMRRICLSLPETAEVEQWEAATFRVRNKIFAMTSDEDGRSEAWVKGAPGMQEMLIGAAPDRFFKPPYLGPKGWIGIRFTDDTDWDEVTDLIEESYRLVAPKKLAALLDAPR